jgi:hypothetical protein
VRRQRANVYAAGNRGRERPGDFGAIEAEDQDVNRPGRLIDGGDDRRDARVRLDDELHTREAQQVARHLGSQR